MFGGFSGNPVYVGAPGQVAGNVNPQISVTDNGFHDLVMEAIVCIGRFRRPGPRRLDYLALRGVEFHIPVSLLHIQFVKSC